MAGGIAGIGEDVIDRSIEKIGWRKSTRPFGSTSQCVPITRAFVPTFPRAVWQGRQCRVVGSLRQFRSHGQRCLRCRQGRGHRSHPHAFRSLGRDGIALTSSRPARSIPSGCRRLSAQEFQRARSRAHSIAAMPGPNDVATRCILSVAALSDQISGELIRVSGGFR